MIYIFLATLLYTAAIVLSAAASRHANTTLAAALTTVVSAILPVIIVIPLISKKIIHDQKFGISMAILAGVAIAFFAIIINKSFAINKVGIVTPIVFGGAIFLSTVISGLIFHEKITPLQLSGLLILALGFGIIIYARATQ